MIALTAFSLAPEGLRFQISNFKALEERIEYNTCAYFYGGLYMHQLAETVLHLRMALPSLSLAVSNVSATVLFWVFRAIQ